jgi:Transcription factor WhiB
MITPELPGAACRIYLTPDHWFSTSPAERKAARHVCETACPALAECRAWALTLPADVRGVIGGLTRVDRERIRKECKHRERERRAGEALRLLSGPQKPRATPVPWDAPWPSCTRSRPAAIASLPRLPGSTRPLCAGLAAWILPPSRRQPESPGRSSAPRRCATLSSANRRDHRPRRSHPAGCLAYEAQAGRPDLLPLSLGDLRRDFNQREIPTRVSRRSAGWEAAYGGPCNLQNVTTALGSAETLDKSFLSN